jgi:putative component of membrane protein insertase Oxa1/YidC/SpoIIIJ protein YidD
MCAGLQMYTPAIIMAGVLLSGLVRASLAGEIFPADLAWQLYSEGDWQHAHVEAQRQIAEQPETAHRAQALARLTDLRLQGASPTRVAEIHHWLGTQRDPGLREWTLLELDLATAAPPVARRSLAFRSASVIIGFYQRQIGPAIGQRCAMYPSCSHYSLEACRRYGLAGIPMTADRLVRETDHVRYRINPVQMQGRERYHDPVEDHAIWFRRYRK